MILKTVRIENYKCIRDSNEYKVDPRVTCLVGKNESGKTAILQALSKLNPLDSSDVPPDFNDLEYPRHKLNEYQESSEVADALTTTWELDRDDVSKLAAIIGEPAASKIGPISISKGYDKEVTYDFAVDEQAVVNHLIESHGLLEDEKKAVEGAKDVAELHTALSAIEDPSQRQKDLVENVTKTFEGKPADQAVTNFFDGRLPKIAYFSEYSRMPGQVSVNDIKNRQSNKTLKSGHYVFIEHL